MISPDYEGILRAKRKKWFVWRSDMIKALWPRGYSEYFNFHFPYRLLSKFYLHGCLQESSLGLPLLPVQHPPAVGHHVGQHLLVERAGEGEGGELPALLLAATLPSAALLPAPEVGGHPHALRPSWPRREGAATCRRRPSSSAPVDLRQVVDALAPGGEENI